MVFFELPTTLQKTAFGLVLLGSCAVYWSASGVLLDDAYIYIRVARNLLAGHGPRFNTGDAHMPITGVGWLLVLVASKIAVPWASWVVLAKSLFVLLLAGASGFLYAVLAPRLPLAAVLAPLPVFFAPWMRLLCGHDVALALAAGVGLIWAFQSGRLVLLPIFAAACYMARGEGAVFAGLLLTAGLIRARASPEGRSIVRRMLFAGLAAGIVVGAWHVYYASEFGALLPSTLSTKAMQAQGPWPPFERYLGMHLERVVDRGVWIPFAALGALVAALIVPPLAVWPVVQFAALVAFGVAYYFWYYYPLDLFVGLSLIVGMSSVLGAAARGLRIPSRPLTAWALVVIAVGSGLAIFSSARPGPVRFDPAARSGVRYRAYSEIASWVADRVPASAGSTPVVLSEEIGVFGFLLPGHRVLDTAGLAAPVEDPRDFFHWARFTKRFAPDVILKTWTDDVEGMVLPGPGGGYLAFERSFRPSLDYHGVSVFTPPDPDDLDEWFTTPVRNLLELARDPLSAPIPLLVERRAGLGFVLFAYARSVLQLPVADVELRELHVGYGLYDRAWQRDATGGVRFEVQVEAPTGQRHILWSRELHPLENERDRGPQSVVVALPESAVNQLVFLIDPLEDNKGDWSYWSGIELR
jgi:hypothetical protein